MRVLVQRVSSAEVRVGGASVGAIGRGLLALVGVGAGDSAADAEFVARKLLGLRVFEDAAGRAWSGSVSSLGLSLLLVSQFTLHASCRKTKPSFQRALGGEAARPLFDEVVRRCRSDRGVRVETGAFGEMMDVSLVNSGPVTLWLDSKNPHDLPWPAAGVPEAEAAEAEAEAEAAEGAAEPAGVGSVGGGGAGKS
jgi:D-tyrosyl-tRNA(Tyr) deacylase